MSVLFSHLTSMFRSNFVYPCSALQVIAEMFLPLFSIFALAVTGVHIIDIVIFADTFEFQTKHFFVSQFPIFYSQQILAACVVITIDTVIVKTMLLMLVSYKYTRHSKSILYWA